MKPDTNTKSQVNSFQGLFDRQRNLFATGVTRSYEWRIEQLDRMGRLLQENEKSLQKAVAQDFKTATQEYIFETFACLGEVMYQKSQLKDWMKPVEAPVPRALAATGHRGIIYRDPYGVVLVMAWYWSSALSTVRFSFCFVRQSRRWRRETAVCSS